MTEEQNDGKAFFGRDTFANYILAGYRQLSTDMFRKENNKIVLHFEEDVVRKLWDNYYVPYISGYLDSSGKFRIDDIKVGNILARVSLSSSVTYFPDRVILNDEESYPIELEVLECPKFQGGKDYQIQQGAGMLVLKSSEKEQRACAEFLKWFTSNEQNIAFSTAKGYLPVTKSADNQMYTSIPFKNGTTSRAFLEKGMRDLAKRDREIVEPESGKRDDASGGSQSI